MGECMQEYHWISASSILKKDDPKEVKNVDYLVAVPLYNSYVLLPPPHPRTPPPGFNNPLWSVFAL